MSRALSRSISVRHRAAEMLCETEEREERLPLVEARFATVAINASIRESESLDVAGDK